MRLKKTLAFALAIAMVFGLVSMAAAAPAAHGTAFGDVAADHPKARQITALGALGISVGDAGLGSNFNPDGTLTRAEFAVFAVRTAGKEGAAKALGSYAPSFNDAADIPEWAYGYINVAQSEGIVIGDDQGNFNAGAPVTYAEALTMLVRVTGWQETVTGTVWPMNYMTRAIDLGISKDVSLQASTQIARSDMAALVYNAGFLDKPEKKDGAYTGEKVAGTAPFASQSKKGLLSGYDPVRGTVLLGSETLNLADNVYLNGFASIAAATGRDVRVLISDKKVVYIEAAATGVDVAGAYDKIEKVTDADGDQHGYIVLKDGTKVEFDGDTKVSVNGGAAGVGVVAHNASGTDAQKGVRALRAGDHLDITTVQGTAASVAITRYVGGVVSGKPHAKKADDVTDYSYVPVDSVYGAGNDFKVRIDRATITLNGEAVTFDQLAEDDILRVAMVNGEGLGNNRHAHRIEATRQTLEGTIESRTIVFTTDNVYRVSFKVKLADGTTKDLSWAASFDKYADAVVKDGAADLTPNAPSKGAFHLNAAGNAVFFDDKGTSKLEYAKLVGVIGPDATPTHVSLDIGGVVNTYEINMAAGPARPTKTDVGYLGAFKLADNKLTDWQVAAALGSYTGPFEVKAVDLDRGYITYDNSGLQVLVSPMVYGQHTNGAATAASYIGLEGLKAKDQIFIFKGTDPTTSAVLKFKAAAGEEDADPADFTLSINPVAKLVNEPDREVVLTAAGVPKALTDGDLTAMTVTLVKAGLPVHVHAVTAGEKGATTVTFDLPDETILTAGEYKVILSFTFQSKTWSATTTFTVVP